MDAPVSVRGLRCRGNVGAVAIIPGVALVRKIIETCKYEDHAESGDAQSADCWHGRVRSRSRRLWG